MNLEERLRRDLEGEVHFDAFTRGRYSTDASIYQIDPIAVVLPKSVDDIAATIDACRAAGVPLVPRGAGTSQCGQTIGRGVIVDTSKFLDQLLAIDTGAKTATVRPGIVLDRLNRQLKKHGLFFPVDPSTANRATIGGMTANNSSGARSIRYGTMVDNVRAIDATLASGENFHFADLPSNLAELPDEAYRKLATAVRSIGLREAGEVAARFPKLLRRVGGYNLDTIAPEGHNLAKLLVGSEGTLAFFTAIELELADIPRQRVLGLCRFPTFYDAMDAPRHLVTLEPVAVELVDRTMLELARQIPLFAPTIEKFVPGDPAALLLVEFAGDELSVLTRKLEELAAMMESLGFHAAVVPLTSAADQTEMWDVRKAGLDIISSMRGDGKPVSIVEDCAVGLEDLAEFTKALNEVFARSEVEATWYAHASVGCLHVRPVLNMKSADDVAKFRAIAEEGFALVRRYHGSHSGEHGDGILRSEFHAQMFGDRLVSAFEEIKDTFDPAGTMNPGKIVRAPRMDDRSLFRYKPDYARLPIRPVLDWSSWPGGYSGAVEMCNNNGACRKDEGVMCPSFMVTKDEEHSTRGRANTLRLALSGQLGPSAFTSEDMYATMDLCISCKACRRECPTGVDMARMKIEFLHQYHRRHRRRLRDRFFAHLPHFAVLVSGVRWLANAGTRFGPLRSIGERLIGISSRRSLPAWQRRAFDARGSGRNVASAAGRDVVLLVDTFNTYFEPANARAAYDVLRAAGYNVVLPMTHGRPLCCGRTFLSAGLIDHARSELWRTLSTLRPYVERGVPIVGLEPSCLLTFRDEALLLLPGPESKVFSEHCFLLEEFLAREEAAGNLRLELKPLSGGVRRAVVHGHCHQKAFGAMPAVQRVLGLIPELTVEVIDAGCCGMAGTFGYEAEHFDTSMQMAELKLLPAVRATDEATIVVADGVSCRHQIRDGAQREALHVARVLASAIGVGS